MGNFIRLYTKDGLTHIEEMDLTTHPELATLQAAKGVVFRTTKPGYFSDWHNAPRRQFVITLAGEVEIGLADGSKPLRPGARDAGRGSHGKGTHDARGRKPAASDSDDSAR
jgi:hypothetical protein